MVSQASWATPPFHSFLPFLLKTKPENKQTKAPIHENSWAKRPAVDTPQKKPWSPWPASMSRPTLSLGRAAF